MPDWLRYMAALDLPFLARAAEPPAGYKLAPHAHPDDREVTMSGTWHMGYGEQFDEAALKALPAGSFYTEPANVAHFVEVKEPAVIQ